jgi:serpin B
MYRTPTLSSLLALTTLIACDPSGPNHPGACEIESYRSTEVSAERAVLVEDNSAFAWELYQQLRADDENLFFSPISISAALDMTRLGASGQTLDEMADVLGTSQEESIHHAEQGGLLQELDSSDTCSVKLSIANRVFPQTGTALLSSFEDSLSESYGAPAEPLDFATDSEAARAHINGWISDNTEEKIPELFPAGTIDGGTRLVLANAIYMKADWAHPFDSDRTQDGSFALIDGSSVETPMMQLEMEEGLHYAQIDGAELVELPYEGGELSMVIVVPEEDDGLPELEASLSGPVVQSWFDSLASYPVMVSMPALEMRWKSLLNEPLIGLGMESAFSTSADFSGMSDELSLMIDVVIHEAYVKIDEEGTEAAAATGVGMIESSVPDYRTVTADRPFLFLVRDRITDSVVFIGRVADPTAG